MIKLDAANTLISAFVTSRIDNCNAIFLQAAAVKLRHLRSVLNTTANQIVHKKKYDNITPVILNELHWLPVPPLIKYKVCRFVFKCLHQSLPSYLEWMCIPIGNLDSRRHLPATARGDLVVSWAKIKTYDTRSFAFAESSACKLLSPNTCNPSLTFSAFHRFLKTELFLRKYDTVSHYRIVTAFMQ